MNRLFWRFFLVFWATLLFATILLWLTNKIQQTLQPEVQFAPPQAMLMQQTARSLLQSNALPQLQHLLQEWENTPQNRISVLLLNRQQQDYFGRDTSQIPPFQLPQDTVPDYIDDTGQRWYLKLVYESPLAMRPLRPLPLPELMPLTPSPLADRPGLTAPPPPLPFWLHPLFRLVVILLASLLFSMLLARYISRPVQQLKQALSGLAANQWQTQLNEDLTRRQDEFGDLSRRFNQMASGVSAAIESQRRLLHDVSHELRSPLARMQILTGLAAQSPESAMQVLEKVEQETARLNQLVDEILTFSRLESGNIPLQPVEVNLRELLLSICHDARLEADSQHKSLWVELAETAAVYGDPSLLYRACENIIRNAVKFTAEYTEVSITLQQQGNKIMLHVKDQGPGVPENAQEKLFTPFFRAHSSYQGVGLGLSIAKRATEACGGSISVQNIYHQQKISGFHVTLTFQVRNL